jgi:hypothetical protein
MNFNIEKSESHFMSKDMVHQRYLSINPIKQFHYFLDKFENVYIFDESLVF